MRQRIFIIDLLRTVAVLMMIIFHAAFDLQMLRGWEIDVFHGIWNVLRIVTASLFLGLAGISTHFTRHPHMRAGKIAIAAALVTLGTLIWDQETYIRFGILHCIAVSAFLLPLCARMRHWNILLGIAVLLIGNAVSEHVTQTSLLIPFGFVPPFFATLDYYPLLPWFGVTLIGYGLGFILPTYRSSLTAHSSPLTTHHSQLITLLTFPGRHALLIYLLHQPILLGLLNIL